MCPFFYLGIVYRQIERGIKISVKNLIIMIAIYTIIISVDRLYIGSNITIAMHEYINLPIVFLYGLLGIVILIEVSKRIYKVRFINYIGKHSLLFYFLNGIALQFVTKVANIISIGNGGYLSIIFIATIACLLTFPVVWFILVTFHSWKEGNDMIYNYGTNISWIYRVGCYRMTFHPYLTME